MKRLRILVACTCVLALMAGIASANTVSSSTLWFEGQLTYNAGTGAYTGTIAAIAGYYYVAGGPGTVWDPVDGRYETPDGQAAVGGFDVYADAGGTAYVQGMSPSSWTIGSDHDAYSSTGPWGTWYDPDCADWDKYELELTADHWYLRYAPTDESPMSGSMNWTAMYAAETDLGTQDGGHDGSATHGGGAQAWDWDCGWGVEVIPLELPGFLVAVTDIGSGDYRVSLTPIPEPVSLIFFGTGLVGVFGFVARRKMRKA